MHSEMITDLRMTITDVATGEIFFDEKAPPSADPAAFMYFGEIYALEMGYRYGEYSILLDLPTSYSGDVLPF